MLPKGRTFIFDGIRNYQKTTGSTVLIVSHSMEDMARYCDDMIVMADSRVVMHGSCREVFSQVDDLSEIGLDIPQITQLMQLLKKRGLDIPKDVYTVEDAVSLLRALYEKGGNGK